MRTTFPARRPFLIVGVTGESMLPALRPGDLLLIRRYGGSRLSLRAGDVVVACHPARPQQLIVKRIAFRSGTGWWLESDNQRAPGRQDSWDFDALPDRLVVGRPVLRYWPPSRWSTRFRRRSDPLTRDGDGDGAAPAVTEPETRGPAGDCEPGPGG